MYRAGRGRAAPLRKVTIGPFGSPWTVETARTEASACSARWLPGVIRLATRPRSARCRRRASRPRTASAPPSRSGSSATRPTTARSPRCGGSWSARCCPLWGDRALASIRKRDVIELIDGIADRGAKVVANRALAYVRRFFNWCRRRDLIEVNPAQFVEKPARRGPARPRARRCRAGRGVARGRGHGRAVRGRRAAADPDRGAALRDFEASQGRAGARRHPAAEGARPRTTKVG